MFIYLHFIHRVVCLFVRPFLFVSLDFVGFYISVHLVFARTLPFPDFYSSFFALRVCFLLSFPAAISSFFCCCCLVLFIISVRFFFFVCFISLLLYFSSSCFACFSSCFIITFTTLLPSSLRSIPLQFASLIRSRLFVSVFTSCCLILFVSLRFVVSGSFLFVRSFYFVSPSSVPIRFSFPAFHQGLFPVPVSVCVPFLFLLFRFTPFPSVTFRSVPFHFVPFRFCSVSFRSVPFRSFPFHSVSFSFFFCCFIPFRSI